MFLLKKMWYSNRIKQIKRKLSYCGENVYIHPSVEIVSPELVSISRNSHFQMGCKLFGCGGGIEIGEGTIFSHDIQVFARNHNYDGKALQLLPYDERFIKKQVKIGKYVWVGARATILPGVTIGDGAVIGAASVVTCDIPSGAIVGGNPARVLKMRDMDTYNALAKDNKSYIERKCKQREEVKHK